MSRLTDKIVCIFGNSRCSAEAEEYRHAERLGHLLGRAGAIVCTGGYDGVMEAASRGARRAGGVVIGVTVDIFDEPPNRYVTREIRVPNLFARLKTMAELADGFVGLRGGIGTITEVAFMWNLLVLRWFSSPTPFLLIGTPWRRVVRAWARHLAVDGRDLPHVVIVDSAEQAFDHLCRAWPERRSLLST